MPAMSYCHRHRIEHGPEGCHVCATPLRDLYPALSAWLPERAGIKQSEPPPRMMQFKNEPLINPRVALPPAKGSSFAENLRASYAAMDWGSPDGDSTAVMVRPKAPTPVYTIPARDVVPGMLRRHGRDGSWRPVVNVERFRYDNGDAGVQAWFEQGFNTEQPDAMVDVTLPGPSPRELCCIGCITEPWMRVQGSPDSHAESCPVAPVEGLHGGMRLWTAPWRGIAWTWNGEGWAHVELGQIGPTTMRMELRNLSADRRDMVLQAFYHPPRATFEVTPLDPWVKRLGNGATPWNPEDL